MGHSVILGDKKTWHTPLSCFSCNMWHSTWNSRLCSTSSPMFILGNAYLYFTWKQMNSSEGCLECSGLHDVSFPPVLASPHPQGSFSLFTIYICTPVSYPRSSWFNQALPSRYSQHQLQSLPAFHTQSPFNIPSWHSVWNYFPPQ